MDLKEALKEIKRLQDQNQRLAKKHHVLEKKHDVLADEYEKTLRLLFEANEKLNQLLKDKENAVEKYTIERVKKFMPQTEVMKPIIINEVETLVKAKKNRKAKSKNFRNFNFERHVSEVRYEKPEESVCPACGNDLSIVSEKVRYVVESIPATLKVTKIIKQSCKCPACNPKNNQIYYPLSTSLFPGSIMTHSFAAFISYHKYELGIPFEHLSRHIKETLDIDMSKQNLALYMAKLATILKPIYERMKADLLDNQARVIHADETTLSISKRPEADLTRKKSYVYVYTSSYYDRQIALYDFHESRAIDRTAIWLKDYEGVIVCDDYAGYTKLRKDNPKIRLQRCFAHVRRRFADIVKVLPEANHSSSHAVKILEVIGRLFHLESVYKKAKLTVSEILIRRNKEHPAIIKELEKLLFSHAYKPGSALESAVNYAKKVWGDLSTYLSSGYIEISNNVCERAVKPFVINRKAFMTSGSYDGARYTTLMFSIIRTARMNDLNVAKYLEYVLDHIQTKNINELLPYSTTLDKSLRNT
ncbi:MAG: IS66 family transposase [Candidatus Izemoplasmatales bacterium]|nr:IS66 family transposase [Candidatus Izemoplasmatales bacterium]